jgi:cytochrome c peroxidase
MFNQPLERIRRRIAYGMSAALVLGLVWFLSPGLPVLWGPRASAKEKEAGRELFEHEWQPFDPLARGDGLGPVFNARSCVACHFQGGVGGGGTNDCNVLTYEIHPSRRNPQVRQGLVHASAIDASFQESLDTVRKEFPVIKGSTTNVVRDHCSYSIRIPDFDPVHTESINTPALFGTGWIDLISGKSITHNWMRKGLTISAKELSLEFDSVPAGRPRYLSGGRVGKFGWKAQFATLEEFVAAACVNELGLSNPHREQAKPLARTDYPAFDADLDRKQFSALFAFVNTLPRPVEVVPEAAGERDRAVRGKELFHTIGCAACHTPDMGGVKGVYSDFLLHRLASGNGSDGSYNGSNESPEALPWPEAEFPAPDEWKTPPLWGVADSAPYFHDGGSRTLRDAIVRHGGDASAVTKTYTQLSKADQQAVIAFLNTLKAPPDAVPVTKPTVARGPVAKR